VILRVGGHYGYKLRDLKILRKAGDLRLPGYLYNRSGAISSNIGFSGTIIRTHRVQIRLREVLSKILREVLASRDASGHGVTHCHPARLSEFLIRCWNVGVKFGCFGGCNKWRVDHS
jgi:glutamate dehydrogenase/leucine dehydrogenase